MMGQDAMPDTGIGAAQYVVTLTDLGRHEIAQVGGKAAGLGELLRARLPVPAGFCVTAAAYRRFVSGAGLTERVRSFLGDAPSLGPPALDDAARAIRSLFATAAVPPDVAAATAGPPRSA